MREIVGVAAEVVNDDTIAFAVETGEECRVVDGGIAHTVGGVGKDAGQALRTVRALSLVLDEAVLGEQTTPPGESTRLET